MAASACLIRHPQTGSHDERNANEITTISNSVRLCKGSVLADCRCHIDGGDPCRRHHRSQRVDRKR